MYLFLYVFIRDVQKKKKKTQNIRETFVKQPHMVTYLLWR